jgi:hypothetical protein
MIHPSARGLLAIALLAAAALGPEPAAALPSYGTKVNAYCASHQRTPAAPFTGDCTLCHGVAGPTSNPTPRLSAYRANDLDAFCPAATAANRPPALTPIGNQSVSEEGS